MIFITDRDRLVILANALKAREEEILQYQINIDNYRLAINDINELYPDGISDQEAAGNVDSPSIEDMKRINALMFSVKLTQLAIETELEQDKARFIMNVILKQLDGVDIRSLVSSE